MVARGAPRLVFRLLRISRAVQCVPAAGTSPDCSQLSTPAA